MIDVADRLPTFSLENQDGQRRSNESYAGKWLVLYVYPEDDTPGCTTQGKGFTATRSALDAEGAVVVGLSIDDVTSHKAFCTKFAFTIELLADPREELLGALGVSKSEWEGKMYPDRTTFLVDPGGVVRKIYVDVDPDGHDKAVLADLEALKR